MKVTLSAIELRKHLASQLGLGVNQIHWTQNGAPCDPTLQLEIEAEGDELVALLAHFSKKGQPGT